jgi:hypothetical protein
LKKTGGNSMLLATGNVTSTVIVGVDSKITCGVKRTVGLLIPSDCKSWRPRPSPSALMAPGTIASRAASKAALRAV